MDENENKSSEFKKNPNGRYYHNNRKGYDRRNNDNNVQKQDVNVKADGSNDNNISENKKTQQNFSANNQNKQAQRPVNNMGNNQAFRNQGMRDNRPRNIHHDYAKFDKTKIKEIETVEDISEDILRIEKEIELEVREISALKMGM